MTDFNMIYESTFSGRIVNIWNS